MSGPDGGERTLGREGAAVRPGAVERARRVRMLLSDVDGTLTDGTLWVLPDGEEIKAYHVRDGLGILLARLAGLKVGLVTGKTSRALSARAERLLVDCLYQGAIDKRVAFREILERFSLAPDEVAFVGDDLGDLAVMAASGLAAAPSDADADVRSASHYVCATPGGRGAVREVIEFILKAQGSWDDVKTRAAEVRNFNEDDD